jgi:hypothetical protein
VVELSSATGTWAGEAPRREARAIDAHPHMAGVNPRLCFDLPESGRTTQLRCRALRFREVDARGFKESPRS